MTALSLVAERAEVRQDESYWIAEANRGLDMKERGEDILAKALQALLEQVGEERWLEVCKQQWKWARSTAYRHAKLGGMAQQREQDAKRRRLGNRDVAEPDNEAEAELARAMVLAGFDVMKMNGEEEPEVLVAARDWALGKFRTAGNQAA